MARKPLIVDINPALLVWARTSRGLPVYTAAGRIKVPSKRLRKWESGEEKITLYYLEKLATIYHRSLAVFFLPEPPKELPNPEDYRTSCVRSVKSRKRT